MNLFNYRCYTTAVCCIVAALPVLVSGQEGGQSEYQMLHNEVEIFQRYSDNPFDSSFLDSAEYYAKHGNHDVAIVFLEEILDSFTTENIPLTFSTDLIIPGNINLSIRTGIDYNNQEFETKTGSTEDNDIFIDQASKPYVGVQLNYLLNGDYSKGLALNSLIRYDKENFNGFLNLEQKFLTINTNGLVNLNFIFDSNKLYTDLSYKEISSRQLIEWSGGRWRFRLDNTLRFKKYRQPAETMPDFIRDIFDAFLSWHGADSRIVNLDITSDYNESLNFENNDYFEQIYNVQFDQWLGGNFINSVELGTRFNKFKYSLLDSTINNFSTEFRIAPLLGLYINSQMRANIEYNYIYKKYREKSEQEADYHYNYMDFKVMKTFRSNFQVTAGYRFDKKKHIPFFGSYETYIIEQDFHSNGLIAGIDYQNISGWYISTSAMYSWRKYPNASNGDEFSIYYNRNILNLFIMAQVPITEKLNLSILLSYDNDEDKDFDINNMRSSYFTIEMQYIL